jgi:hypothetical protein
VQYGAEIDESLRLREQGCQDVGSNRVDREDMREAIFRLEPLRLLAVNGSQDGTVCLTLTWICCAS